MKKTLLQIAITLLLPSLANAKSNNLCFVENTGQIINQHNQVRNDIDFKINAGKAVNIFIGNGQLHYEWVKDYYAGNTTSLLPAKRKQPAKIDSVSIYRMDVQLIGANVNAPVTKEYMTPYEERYYLPSTNFSGAKAHSWQRITYHDVYPNIDWVLYVKDNTLEYDFVVRPGGKVSDIGLQYSGAILGVSELGTDI